MKTRRILSTILALTMLLTLFGGEFASAAGMKIVTVGEELAYRPINIILALTLLECVCSMLK